MHCMLIQKFILKKTVALSIFVNIHQPFFNLVSLVCVFFDEIDIKMIVAFLWDPVSVCLALCSEKGFYLGPNRMLKINTYLYYI